MTDSAPHNPPTPSSGPTRPSAADGGETPSAVAGTEANSLTGVPARVTVHPSAAERGGSSAVGRRHILGGLGLAGAAAGLAACSSEDPFAKDRDTDTGGGGSEAGGDGHIVVGSQAYYSNEIIAELFAQILENSGRTVDRQYQIGQRDAYMPEMESGALTVMPEYLGNLLQFYTPDAESDTPEAIAEQLAAALPEDLEVLDFADATDQDSYTTTVEFAQKHSLRAIGDLVNVGEDLKIAANTEFEVRPYGPDGAKRIYDVDVAVLPVEDSGGPLTVKALIDGDVQLADIYTADPAIAANDLVVLEDSKAMILPQNVVPLVAKALDDQSRQAIGTVIEKLSAEELIALNRRSVQEQASSADIATAWLEEKGLL